MNRIHVVIGEQDERFLLHLANILENGFSEYIEAHCFAKAAHFMKYVEKNGADVILADENFGVPLESLNAENCGYLCDDPEVRALGGFKTICKYGHPDEIYRDIMDIHANGGRVMAAPMEEAPLEMGGVACDVILVQGFSGGTGVSTFAAAASMYSSQKGVQTFYLNLEDLGDSNDFFSSLETGGLDDVLAALRAGHGGLADFAAEQALIDPGTGVSYFGPSARADRMADLTAQVWIGPLNALKASGSYGRIFVDCGFGLDEKHLAMMEAADRIVLVTDGGETANTKFRRGLQAVSAWEQQEGKNITDKMILFYNRFSSSKSSSRLDGIDLPVVGTMPPVKHALVREIIQVMLSRQNIFERLLQL